MGNIFLLSGEPRVGKTTTFKKIIDKIGKEKCIGFYTEEIRDEFDRIGFDCVSLDGSRKRISDINLKSDVRIGRYGVDVKGFEEFLIQAIDDFTIKNKVIVIDEIGPMQYLSVKFKNKLSTIFKSSNILIGTIYYGKHEEIDEIKKIPEVEIYTLTKENRDTAAENIFEKINNLL